MRIRSATVRTTPELLREVEQIRRAVRDKIEAVGLRPTARLVKLTPTGLKKFAFGDSVPYRPGLKRLREWYASEVSAPLCTVYDDRDRERAIEVLTFDFPDVVATNCRRELQEIRERFGVPRPSAAELPMAA